MTTPAPADAGTKTALVTGASGDIGGAIARRLHEAGLHLALHYRSNEAAANDLCQEIVADGGVAEIYQADLRQPEASQALVESVHEKLGRLDVLVNNAGALQDALVSFMTDEQWGDVIETNLSAAFYVTRPAAMIMARQRQGKIINICSDAGRLGGAGRANYSAAKSGLAGFTRALARELAGSGVQVNAVSPGFIESRMTADINDAKRKELLRAIPARRFGRPEEVAELVAYLATGGGYITGQEISVDGGLFMG